MTQVQTDKPAVSKRRANFGCGAALALVVLAIGVYFAPRAVPQSQVRELCEQTAKQQLKTQGNFDVSGFAQNGYRARFNVTALGGSVEIPAVCSVGGDARNPTVIIQLPK
ncbi:hypothetical protein [Deinococcus sp. QL22]|uniref:hypothetical protein n=1 Tax=Deinococcus sp. QL22 TaxID=2939437 RepID=UPI002017E964|nr:hypothetical protein [Deinococcus sp. QL22]UQN05453.1 hypothetical protein M1R55_11265 [Deinococcus sp. QL22]